MRDSSVSTAQTRSTLPSSTATLRLGTIVSSRPVRRSYGSEAWRNRGHGGGAQVCLRPSRWITAIEKERCQGKSDTRVHRRQGEVLYRKETFAAGTEGSLSR